MNIARSITPEAMWGDAASKARDYAALSRQYAAHGNPLGAVHAMWASDMHTVQAVIWERVMVASPQPDEQFFAITKTLAKALLQCQMRAEERSTAVDCVAEARSGLAFAFDPAALRVIGTKVAPVDHLDGLRAPTVGDLWSCQQERLGGRSAAEVVAERKQASADGVAVAMGMYGEGRLDDAQAQAWRADWAAFEAYLIDAATAIGDESLISVDLRWELATSVISAIPSLPYGFLDAVTVVRDRLLVVVGPVEAHRLAEYFTPLNS